MLGLLTMLLNDLITIQLLLFSAFLGDSSSVPEIPKEAYSVNELFVCNVEG